MTASPDNQSRSSRRQILRTGAACSLWPLAAGVLGAEPASDPSRRTLVLLHLSGGNDGFDTIIPYRDSHYQDARPRLGAIAREAIAIDDRNGFHPALQSVARLFEAGQVAVVQGVGAAEPDYTHAGAWAAWSKGFDALAQSAALRGRPDPVFVEPTASVRGSAARALRRFEGSMPYVCGGAERTLSTAAHVACLREPPGLVFATTGGFDTHADQRTARDCLLRELDRGLAAFAEELARQGRTSHVLLIAWSEFGRRLAENAAGGTDHGTAGVVLTVGGGLPGGLYGSPPRPDPHDPGAILPTVDVADVHRLAAAWLCGDAGREIDLA